MCRSCSCWDQSLPYCPLQPTWGCGGTTEVCVLRQRFLLHAITQAVCAWPYAVQQPQGACSHSRCPSQGCASGAACPSSEPSPSAVAACHDGTSQSTATNADHMIQGTQAFLKARYSRLLCISPSPSAAGLKSSFLRRTPYILDCSEPCCEH